MMKMTKIRLALVLVGLLVSGAAMAQAKYVWIDAQGVKQFSDTPPPGDIPEKNIIKQPHRTAKPKPSSDASVDSDSASDTKAPPSTADLDAEYKKRKAEQAEKDKKAADEAKRNQERAANCERAKRNLEALNSGVRMQTTDSSGQRSVMDDNQRAQETARNQQMVNDCNN